MADKYVSDVFFSTINIGNDVGDGSVNLTHTTVLDHGDNHTTIAFFNSWTKSVSTAFNKLDISYSLFWTGNANPDG